MATSIGTLTQDAAKIRMEIRLIVDGAETTTIVRDFVPGTGIELVNLGCDIHALYWGALDDGLVAKIRAAEGIADRNDMEVKP